MMPSQIKDVELQEKDRVAIVVDGKIVKARVAVVLMNGDRASLTYRDAEGKIVTTVVLRSEIFPLYRYVETPVGLFPYPLCAL